MNSKDVVTNGARDSRSKGSGKPLIVVSADTHVGPRLEEDLRPHCPKKYLDDFDRYAAELRQARAQFDKRTMDSLIAKHTNWRTAGHYDSDARLADYNYDGIAAGVLFNGSQNAIPVPFMPFRLGEKARDPALEAVGQQIFNRFIGEMVSKAPHRHIGLAFIPAQDIDAAVAEIKWAHANGLKGVNFPCMLDGVVPEFNLPLWEPVWEICEELRMPLVTHTGGGTVARYVGPEAQALMQMETFGFFPRRAIWWLIFGGVFERHPGLKLVMAENPGTWLSSVAHDLDAIHLAHSGGHEVVRGFITKCPKRPSEYISKNVYCGASFASSFEAQWAVKSGLETQFMWGSDYPHIEGTFVYPDGTDLPSVTKLALRNTFCKIAPDKAALMVGGNAIEVFNLDVAALESIAAEIGALTPAELATPIDAIPERGAPTAFRTGTDAWN
jgi:predicted TIM-barrel fold metal-dependent hydrolase